MCFQTLLNNEVYDGVNDYNAGIVECDNVIGLSGNDESLNFHEYHFFERINVSSLRTFFRQKISSRWSYVQTNAMGIAFYLDPRHKLSSSKYGDERLVREQIVSFSLQSRLIEQSQVQDLTSQIYDFARAKYRERYMEKTSPISYWDCARNEFPLLGSVPNIIFAIPTSSAASELAWRSIMDHIHSKKRNRLSVDKVKQLVFVYINYAALKSESIDLAMHQSFPESIDG
ncbi:hypothetical protein THRCLA_23316 [Thraustotheca clavata]|uniref:HAT C-terminal dimerisation domain-containing protein n=1 Tax=Thraustotheca clavata TaxID=74557 RepID=A0A1V9Y7F9_9STRA|nr:hypothetical protein THRCLA_23316 [Thraustotheca clavata]